MAFSLEKLAQEEVTFHKGIVGKKILLYGTNDTGKTFQSSKLNKPFLIAVESGASAVNCLKTPCDNWSKFKQIVENLVSDKTFEKSYEIANTVVIDTMEKLVELSERFVCARFGVSDLSEIQGKQNGYKLARNDFSMQINRLTSKGYTVVFIDHEETVEMTDEVTGEVYEFVQPKGTSNMKSSSRMIRDLTDYTIYLKPNGIDNETYEVIPSTAICKRTRNVFARSRFDIQTIINPFTAENLIKAIEEGVESSAEKQNARISEYEVSTEKYTKEDYFEIIKPYIMRLNDLCPDDVLYIVESELGQGKKVSTASDDDLVKLDNIYNLLVTKATLLGVEV